MHVAAFGEIPDELMQWWKESGLEMAGYGIEQDCIQPERRMGNANFREVRPQFFDIRPWTRGKYGVDGLTRTMATASQTDIQKDERSRFIWDWNRYPLWEQQKKCAAQDSWMVLLLLVARHGRESLENFEAHIISISKSSCAISKNSQPR